MEKKYSSKKMYTVTFTKKEYNEIRMLLEDLHYGAGLAQVNAPLLYMTNSAPRDLEAFKAMNNCLKASLDQILVKYFT